MNFRFWIRKKCIQMRNRMSNLRVSGCGDSPLHLVHLISQLIISVASPCLTTCLLRLLVEKTRTALSRASYGLMDTGYYIAYLCSSTVYTRWPRCVHTKNNGNSVYLKNSYSSKILFRSKSSQILYEAEKFWIDTNLQSFFHPMVECNLNLCISFTDCMKRVYCNFLIS